jgi:sulfur-carrier protein adenylyltransferase/sulfurtransferase
MDAVELERYGRHLVLPEVGLAGQEKLKKSSVLIVGMGGLGSPAALYLAAAGIGRIGLVDFDRVEVSNLHRQVLFSLIDVGRPKVEVAAERLAGQNPLIAIEQHFCRLDLANARELIGAYDLVLDGSDNAATRYLINDAALLVGRPIVWGAVAGFEGQLSIFATPEGPCYRCLFPEPPPSGLVPSCAEGGVLGVLPGLIGCLQASEAIKLILGKGQPAIGRILIYDALRLRFREVLVPPNHACRCRSREFPLEAIAEICSTGAPNPPREEMMTMSGNTAGTLPLEIDVEELAVWREAGRDFLLIDVREEWENELCRIDGACLIPLGQLSERLDELDPDKPIVVHCHHGGRSMQAVRFLRGRGRGESTNLRGGIDAWSLRIDPDVRRY